jgi:hypothetical protein
MIYGVPGCGTVVLVLVPSTKLLHTSFTHHALRLEPELYTAKNYHDTPPLAKTWNLITG